MAKLVTIYGGSGFVGRYIARRLARDGWRIRVAVRRPNEAMHVKTYGGVSQVEPVFCNIRDDASVRAVMQGADAVINCVGILAESGANSFEAIQHQGAARIARIAAEQGVANLVHLSAIGASKDGLSEYSRTKALGEDAVQANFPDAVILRPSVIFGAEDQFFNKFAKMAAGMPVVNIAGGNTLFQPVYVDDVANAAVLAVSGGAAPGVYELGGPEVKSLRALIADMLTIIHRRRLVVNLPFFAARIAAAMLDFGSAMTMGILSNKILTRDQLKGLRSDSVVSDGANGFEALGINPTPMELILTDYLWCYRPAGQFDAIKESAKNLRKS
jgi:uncharacterized protein YbjT (DUF2867 family)